MCRDRRSSWLKSVPLVIALASLFSMGLTRVGFAVSKITAKGDDILSKVNGGGQPLIKALYGIDKLPDDERVHMCVFLLNYYLGEIGTEIHYELITKIGDRIVPSLIEKKTKPIECLDRYSNICVKNIAERNRKIGLMLDAIRKGIVLYLEYPQSVDDTITTNMKIITVFLNDYKIENGKYPSSLSILREYGWAKYGYKMVITNPYGQPYLYESDERNYYKLERGKDKDGPPLG